MQTARDVRAKRHLISKGTLPGSEAGASPVVRMTKPKTPAILQNAEIELQTVDDIDEICERLSLVKRNAIRDFIISLQNQNAGMANTLAKYEQNLKV